MAITNAGAIAAASALVGDGGVAVFNNANARIGVGDSTTAFNATQTDLVATTNKLRKAMDDGYPTRTNGAITFRATFNTSEANFAWNEIGVFNSGPTGGTMLNRVVQSLNTKSPSETWIIQLTATVAAA